MSNPFALEAGGALDALNEILSRCLRGVCVEFGLLLYGIHSEVVNERFGLEGFRDLARASWAIGSSELKHDVLRDCWA